MAFIIANNGPHLGKRYELTVSKSLVGRHPDCQVVLEVGAVSRHHAQIVADNGKYFVEDLQSRNGTYVNDQMIDGRHPLNQGDLLRICDVAFTFHTGQESQIRDSQIGATVAGIGRETVVIEDDEGKDSGSTIMSKLDVSSSHGRLQYTASAEIKLNALLEITQALSKAVALAEVLPSVLDGLFKIFVQADRGFVVMATADGNLVPMGTKVRRQDSEDTIRISRTIVKQVMESKEAILSADAASDARFDMSQSIADFRIRSMMCAPLLDNDGNALGVLQIDTHDQRKRFQQEDLEVLASVAAQASVAIDNAQLHEESLRQREIERDLEVAHEVQRSFLPERPPQLDGYRFFNYYQPANHVGGDYYDYIPLPDGRVAVIVADVVGHGVAASLLMAKIAAEARYCLASESDVGVAVGKLNKAISDLNLDRFITMIMVVLDPATHAVSIVNAGHMAPMYRKTDGSLEEPGDKVAGLPLGILDDVEYAVHQINLAAGESLTMYTDGLNECCNSSDVMYGIERLRSLLTAAESSTPDILGKTIIEDVRSYLAGGTQDDDMCLVVFGRE